LDQERTAKSKLQDAITKLEFELKDTKLGVSLANGQSSDAQKRLDEASEKITELYGQIGKLQAANKKVESDFAAMTLERDSLANTSVDLKK
jgi:chromosome segregation ATPase